MSGRHSAAGFTLIEVVVGLAVGGIVILTGFAALGSVQDRSEHAAAATTAALEGATARAALIDWISAALLNANALQAIFEGSDAREQGLISDELVVPTEAPTPRRVPITAVRLFLDVDVNTAERGLVAEFVGVLGEAPLRLEIAPEVVRMSIRYLPVSDTPVEWAESWIGQNQLPRAVEMILEDAPGEPLPPLLRFPIRVPLANAQ